MKVQSIIEENIGNNSDMKISKRNVHITIYKETTFRTNLAKLHVIILCRVINARSKSLRSELGK